MGATAGLSSSAIASAPEKHCWTSQQWRPHILKNTYFIPFAVIAATAFFVAASSAADIDAQLQSAVTEAVERVAPSVVQIETVGGLERVEGQLLGSGPTTGLVVDPDGYIVSSAFNFASKPASIIVRLPDGSRKPAKLVATDHSRMLVLLKIDAGKPLPVGENATREQMRVGQWAVALGRAFETGQPNLAVGILSALERVNGKAIQTDAAVSPNNYGGPLIGLHGRILGILAPLSPRAAGQIGGMEWYDSGIGFAVPMEDVLRALPRLKKGEDLHPGLAGISLEGPNIYANRPVVASCLPKCPATSAGLKIGDEIVEINGRPITRAVEVNTEIGRHYAGDTMNIAFLRDGKRITGTMKLAEKLLPFEHGFLGILPMRDDGRAGVAVRYVYPKSPAADAGIKRGDLLVAIGGEPIKNRFDLIGKVGLLEPGETVQLTVNSGGTEMQVKTVLAALPTDPLSEELPPAGYAKPGDPAAVQTGSVQLKIPEFTNEAWAYVPESCKSGVPCGVVIWLHAPGGYDWKELLPLWKDLCDCDNLILLAPKSADPTRWTRGETDFIDQLLDQIDSTYGVDRTRIVTHGYQGGGSMAFIEALGNRDMIRAVAAVEAIMMGKLPQNEPTRRLAIYLASSEKSNLAPMIKRVADAFGKAKFPVTVVNLGDTPRYLNEEEMSQLARWIDTLDRI